MQQRRSNYIYMEYLRVLCAFMVIVIHVSGINWFKIEIGSFNWIIQTFFNIGGRFSVCVFCMISGALFLSPDKTVNVHDVFHKYIRRILICFVTWTVFYSVFYTALNHGNAQYFILHLFQLPKHLWYLLMLIGLYLVTPILKLITKDRTMTRYMIWILLSFGTVFGMIVGITGFIKPMAGDAFGFSIWNAFLGDLEYLNMTFVPGYLGFFLLGHYIHEYGLGKWHRTLVLAAIPSLLLSAVLTIALSKMTGSYVYTFMFETNPLVAAASVGIFAYFRGAEYPAVKESADTFMEKAAVWIGSRSLGIYLVHLAVLDILEHYFSLSVASFNPLLSVPCISILVFLISAAISAVLKSIPVIRNTVS